MVCAALVQRIRQRMHARETAMHTQRRIHFLLIAAHHVPVASPSRQLWKFYSNISLARLIRSLNFCAAESALAPRTLLTTQFCKLSRSQNASSCTGSKDKIWDGWAVQEAFTGDRRKIRLFLVNCFLFTRDFLTRWSIRDAGTVPLRRERGDSRKSWARATPSL